MEKDNEKLILKNSELLWTYCNNKTSGAHYCFKDEFLPNGCELLKIAWKKISVDELANKINEIDLIHLMLNVEKNQIVVRLKNLLNIENKFLKILSQFIKKLLTFYRIQPLKNKPPPSNRRPPSNRPPLWGVVEK